MIDKGLAGFGRKRHAEAVRRILAERFPKCFAKAGEPKRPLKIGIGEDIMLAMPELSSYGVKIGLEDYTFGRSYIDRLTPGAARIGLDGSEHGFVREEEAGLTEFRRIMFELDRLHKPNKAREAQA